MESVSIFLAFTPICLIESIRSLTSLDLEDDLSALLASRLSSLLEAPFQLNDASLSVVIEFANVCNFPPRPAKSSVFLAALLRSEHIVLMAAPNAFIPSRSYPPTASENFWKSSVDLLRSLENFLILYTVWLPSELLMVRAPIIFPRAVMAMYILLTLPLSTPLNAEQALARLVPIPGRASKNWVNVSFLLRRLLIKSMNG